MTAKTAKPIEIFAVGTHTPMQGGAITFAAPDLAATAAAYDPAVHEAPLVIGHPKTDAPAYGWVQSLAADGDRMLAIAHQVDPAFAEMVAAGRFKKVSASFWAPTSKGNPTPGVYALRHVGFLGAQAPAVKGLKPAEFAAGDEDLVTVTVDFAERDLGLAWGLRSIKRVLSRLRDHLIEQGGAEVGDRAVPTWDLDEIERAATDLERAAQEPASAAGLSPAAFSDLSTTETIDVTTSTAGGGDIAAREAEIAAREATLAAREASFAEVEAKAAATIFIEDLIGKGRVLPAQRERLVAFMASLDEADTVCFAEGDKEIKASQIAAFKDFLTAMPKLVEFGEVAPAGPSFAAGGDDEVIASAAVAYQAEQAKLGRTVTTAQAVAHVKRRGV